MQYPISQCGVILLAAGQSSRMGKPKQLIDFQGKTLIQRAAEAALQSGARPVIAVLGAFLEDIRPELSFYPDLEIVVNEGWREGMASSIRTGLKAVMQAHPGVDGIILMVCDQPRLDAAVLAQLMQIQLYQDAPIAACSYAGKTGTPALFHESLFVELLQLTGDAGARSLLEKMKDNMAILDFEAGALDIDTEDDLRRFIHP